MCEFVKYLFLLLTVLCSVSSFPVRDQRSPQIPPNWKDLLTADVYQYHLNKAHTNQFFEGDIIGIDKSTDDHANQYSMRNAIVDKSMRWESGTVPYEISASFTASEKSIIQEALQDIMRKTCVRFVSYTSQRDYVSFVRRGLGCSSYVARTGGKQLIDLQPGCIYQIGEVQHEVMHALGFYHEQSRTDRDDYVTIVWSNVIAGAEDQFKTYRSDNLNMPYDYESIMHYGWNYFAKDATKPTILPKTKAALGTRVVMSRSDVEKINRLYECPATNGGSPTSRPREQPAAQTRPRIPVTAPPATPGRGGDHGYEHNGHHHRHRPGTTPAAQSPWEDFKHKVKDLIRHEFNPNR